MQCVECFHTPFCRDHHITAPFQTASRVSVAYLGLAEATLQNVSVLWLKYHIQYAHSVL